MKEDEIAVSVFCQTYNQEKYIGKCLDSLTSQRTNFKFEILVHDDASNDETANIIKKYVKKYPDIIVPIYEEENQWNKNVFTTKDILYPKARGKYIAFCEGDDYWSDPEKLQRQYDVLESHNECSLCVHTVDKISENGAKTGDTFPPTNYKIKEGVIERKKALRMVWCESYLFQTSCYFVRREVLAPFVNNEIENAELMNGDLIYLRLAVIFGEIYYIDRKMSCYRLFSVGSWSSSHPINNSKQVHDRFINCIKGEEGFDKFTNNNYNAYIKARITNCILAWSDVYPQEAKEYIKKYNCTLMNTIKYLPAKYSIYFVLLYVAPHLHTIIKRIGRKI